MAGTITDIIKKIRAEADFIEETARGSLKAGGTWDGRPFTESDLESALDLAETKRKEANRLEAALKREMSKNASKNGADFGQLGNAAKLREALEKIVEILNREWDAHRETSAMWEIRDICTAALAAPPRNCERFQTTEQAKEAYCAEVRRVSIWDGYKTERLIDWLLAPATEKEGGNK